MDVGSLRTELTELITRSVKTPAQRARMRALYKQLEGDDVDDSISGASASASSSGAAAAPPAGEAAVDHTPASPVSSPSERAEDSLLQQQLAFFLRGPALSLPQRDGVPCFGHLLGTPVGPAVLSSLELESLCTEEHFYSRIPRPAGRGFYTQRAADAQMTPSAVFGPLSPAWWPAACQPEFHMRASPRHPAVNGELSSMPSIALEQLCTYSMMDMSQSYFYTRTQTDARGGEVVTRVSCWYDSPPLGFAVLGCGAVGYMLAIEWIGVAFVSVYSTPFFLTSDAIARAFEQCPLGAPAPAPLPVSTECVWRCCDVVGDVVSWTLQPVGEHRRFYKCISATKGEKPSERRSPQQLLQLQHVYTRMAALARRQDYPPTLVHSRLLYGEGCLVVEMDWVGGVDASRADLNDDAIVARVASAIVYLATHGIVYTDVRPGNVRVLPDGDVRLVDYDDCVLVKAGPVTWDEFAATLATVRAGYVEEAFTVSAAVEAAVKQALNVVARTQSTGAEQP